MSGFPSFIPLGCVREVDIDVISDKRRVHGDSMLISGPGD